MICNEIIVNFYVLFLERIKIWMCYVEWVFFLPLTLFIIYLEHVQQ